MAIKAAVYLCWERLSVFMNVGAAFIGPPEVAPVLPE